MESSPTPPTITIQVKFGVRTIPVEVPACATTTELKRLLQPLTNVLPRGQRLICKGTDSQTLDLLTANLLLIIDSLSFS
ncbi:hypothetical protein E2562_039250 [Oryza meyeriana var. granulata]|uniref:Ubiquitin-like domain-containing protein n=1 Tax=Oryza meyeriana var. granulata TaxID=110450 RepID=A0A6G1F2E9_9ORYZ|nr:hypothetical protein E2562_039250 [Oryza meyeriana var. granulata]